MTKCEMREALRIVIVVACGALVLVGIVGLMVGLATLGGGGSSQSQTQVVGNAAESSKGLGNRRSGL